MPEILKEEKSVSQLGSERGAHPNLLFKWKNQALHDLPRFFSDDNKKTEAMKTECEKPIEGPYEEIGRLPTQLSWLKKRRLT